MKDISDYLCGTTNTSEDADSVVLKCKRSEGSKNEKQIQNAEKVITSQNVKKNKKKKSRRKASDPAVKNIVELLSNSLCIISPNTSVSSQPESHIHNNEQKQKVITDKISQNKLVLTENSDTVILHQDENNSSTSQKDDTSQDNVPYIDSDKGDNVSSKATKLNAFQFMMESRNKSIGQNSPGKERSTDECKTRDEKEQKEVLSARKSLLQNWTNKKGATKRKREEEEKEEVINYKLQKRARRLKRLLNVDKPADTENDNDVIVKKRRKRTRIISSSSSENSKDSIILQESNTTLDNPVLGVIEENAQDNILNESKRRDSKQGLLNFFGVVNKSIKSSESANEAEVANKKEVIKIKLNNSNLKQKKVKKNLNTEETVNKTSKDVTIEQNRSRKEIVVVEKIKSKKNKKEKCIKELSKIPKSPNTLKNKLDNGDGSFTPRSLKSWKIKIKNNERVEDEADSQQKRPQRSKRISDYKSLFSEDSSREAETIDSRRKKQEVDQVVLCSDDDSNNKKETPKPMKLAPVFTKATPKPKLAPEVVEARKQFLMSGIPDSLKRSIEKQQSVEEKEYDIFPSISHVQQKCETQAFWNLTSPQLNLRICSPLKIEKLVMCSSVTNSRVAGSINIQKDVEKVGKLKSLLNQIKLDNPNYPVYKSFRLIYEKSGKMCQPEKKSEVKRKKDKKRSKSLDKSVEIVEEKKPESDSTEHVMWTDKYKPKCSDDIIGNAEGVKNLKKWLEFWKNCSEEINTKKKKKREEYSSDSEFDTTDCDSRDSTKLPDNTIVVGGPCGSGKSTAIYAICNELGFNVSELNASSKRTGKRLLQELQEATQSHQVRKKKHHQSFYKEDKEQIDKKMCVLLIEDVDIVFEQDDGFISALSQLVSSSKRPIVLTTSDISSAYVQKFIHQYRYISFLPLSSQSLATWLQIVCLVEGLLVNQGDIGGLLEFNKGDVRKTLLQLQFWVQSGGQIVRDDLPVKTRAEIVTVEQELGDDEQELCLEDDGKGAQNIFVHSDCIRSFEVFKHHKSYRVPYYLNLGLLWWNIPNILNIQSFSEDRIKKFKENHFELDKNEKKVTTKPQSKKLIPIEKTKLDSLSKLYDSLAYTDILFKSANHSSHLEPDVKNYSLTIKDSLELGESLDGYDGYKDFVHEITHSLVNGYVEEFTNIEKTESVLNIAVPEKAERRWRAKMHVCEDVFLEALPQSTCLERQSVALDYMPFLRTMARSETQRAANNTKRGNRFRSYLQSLGISYNHNTVKMACNILGVADF